MQPATHKNQLSPPKALMIDPQEEFIEFFRQVLYICGYQLESCQSGREGIEIAARTQPDIMIVEFVLPDIDGLALLQRLRAEEIMGDRPIIVLSSLDDPQIRLQANSVGISAFMSKPLDRYEFPNLVTSLMKQNLDFLRSSPPRVNGFTMRMPPGLMKQSPGDQYLRSFSNCPYCRAEVRFGDNFCLSCGNRISSGGK